MDGTAFETLAAPSPAAWPCHMCKRSSALPDPSLFRHHSAAQFCERISGARPDFRDLAHRPPEADQPKTSARFDRFAPRRRNLGGDVGGLPRRRRAVRAPALAALALLRL